MDRETSEMPTVERRPPQGGFSLMETLIVIAIIAILLALGVPSFKYVTQSNRSTTVSFCGVSAPLSIFCFNLALPSTSMEIPPVPSVSSLLI